MKRLLFVLLVIAVSGIFCSKEAERIKRPHLQPKLDVDLEDTVLTNASKNEYSVYSFGGVAGLYYGCVTTFRIGESAKLEIILGTSITGKLTPDNDDFLELIATGDRKFGSLGAFSSFPGLDPGCVEIAYTDSRGRRWCSTRITEKPRGNSTEVKVRIEESNGSFSLDNIHKVEIAAETEGYRISGSFDCFLFEVNGNAKKKIKGKFEGLVALY